MRGISCPYPRVRANKNTLFLAILASKTQSGMTPPDMWYKNELALKYSCGNLRTLNSKIKLGLGVFLKQFVLFH